MQPIHRTFTKREYQFAPWAMFPLSRDLETVVEQQVCTSSSVHCLSEDPALHVRVTSAFHDFPVTDGELALPILTTWNDDRASQWRDVLLLFAGAVFGMAGACFLEAFRPWLAGGMDV